MIKNKSEISDDLFIKFSDLFYRLSGIKIKDYKKYLIEYRLSKIVGENKNFKSYEELYNALKNDRSGQIKSLIIKLLTTNFTYFFRENEHFEFLAKYLKNNYNNQDYIRLWSAGCSTGEEAYSMAITAMESIPNIYSIDFKILASDISLFVIDFAIEGKYHFSKIKGHIDDKFLKKYFIFDKKNKNFIVKDNIKNLIAFRYLNLMDKFPFNKKFDVVFLRNVLIYFDNVEKEYILNKIYDVIKENGYLILGLAESLVGISHLFKSLKNSIYVKK